MMTNVHPRPRTWAAMCCCLGLLAACGGGDDEPNSDRSAVTTALQGEATPADPESDASDTAVSTTDAVADTWDEGDTGFRVVNTLDEPVDLYVRTTGLVEAFVVSEGVEPGAVTELAYPPTDGTFIVTEAGAGDPTCVTGCDHFIAELAAFPGEGPVHTVVLYDDAFDGPRAFDLWEQPEESARGSANAMPAPDPANGFAVVTAIAVEDTDFGLRLAVDGAGVCEEPFNLDNILIGGNQTPAFAYAGDSVDWTVHGNDDRECVDPTVGGPFTVDGGPGARTHMILVGLPGDDLEAIIVPMLDGADAGAGDSGSADRDLAVGLMAQEVESNLPIEGAQATCTAELLVDAIGADQLLQDGELIDLDTVGTQFDDAAQQAFIDAIEECGLEPEQLGG